MTKLMLRNFDPFQTILPNTFFDQFEKAFAELGGFNPQQQSWSLSKGFPKGDVYVEEDRGVIELALAGYSKEQLSVQVDGNILQISAKKADEVSNEPRTIARRAFTEAFNFGQDFDLSNTMVTFKDGLLRVEVPKTKPEPKVVKVIEIK